MTKNLYVHYSILVVDDDQSAAADGSDNVTSNITEALDELDYGYTYYNRSAQGGIPSENMSTYNMIIWCTGQTSTDTLDTGDVANLTEFLGYYEGSLWLMGQGIINDLNSTPDGRDFLHDVLRISSYTLDSGTPDPILGVDFDDITHGMEFATDDCSV